MRISDWSSDVCSSDLISNGGGAVLRAAELDGDWLDAVVAGEPNVFVEGGRPLYDFATEAALLQPCALLHLAPESMAQPPMRARSEEHTSELQSLMRISYAVFCLKKQKNTTHHTCETHT